MTQVYILAIDQGTTGSTALVLKLNDKNVMILAKHTEEFAQHYPEPGWVEHDLEEVWQSLAKAIVVSLEKAQHSDTHFTPKRIASIGITNQRETLCIFDRKTLKALRPAIVWQCRRSSQICGELKEQIPQKWIQEKTGLVFDPYFSGSKIKWILNQEPQCARAIKEKTAVFSTIDSYILARLSQGQSFMTEASNASRTLLFDINKGSWDNALLDIFGLKNQDCLAQVIDSVGTFGKTKGLSFLPDGIPICAMLGDQQAALAGQSCFTPGEAKCTYGTGAFLLTQLGTKPKFSQHGLVTTVAWSLNGQLSYALEGSSFIAGAAMTFLRDQMHFIRQASESEALARTAQAAPEIYFVPALSGLGAPWWNPNARGAFFGLSRGSTTGQIVRAGLEGVAFQVLDLLIAMAKDMGQPLQVLRVDGGAAANNLLLQMQSDFAEIPVERSIYLENTGLGAGLFAALGMGYFKNLSDIKSLGQVEAVFHPDQKPDSLELRGLQVAGWKKAVKAVQLFAHG